MTSLRDKLEGQDMAVVERKSESEGSDDESKDEKGRIIKKNKNKK